MHACGPWRSEKGIGSLKLELQMLGAAVEVLGLDSVFCKVSQSFKLLNHLTSPTFLVFLSQGFLLADARQVDWPVSLRDPFVSASPVLGF